MKQYDYKTVMFVQISVMSSPTAQMYCKAPLYYRRLSGDGSVATPSFSLAIFLATMVRF